MKWYSVIFKTQDGMTKQWFLCWTKADALEAGTNLAALNGWELYAIH